MSKNYAPEEWEQRSGGQGNQENVGNAVKPEVKNRCNDDEAYKKRSTHLSVSVERYKICELVYKSKGTAGQFEERYNKGRQILNDKQLLFKKTEANYQRYRNFDMLVGSELLQFNDSVKNNITTYNNVFKSLNDSLKNVAKAVRDLKTKTTELKKAGDDLFNCYSNDCNTSQRRALTGKAPGCGDPIKPACPDAEVILEELMQRPVAFMKDADYLFKSSYEVVGIQTFSNVESFNGLHKKLDEQSKKLGKQIAETVKLREGDLKKLQEDVVKSMQELGKSWVELNHERSNFEGYRDAAQFLCDLKNPCTDVAITYPDGYQTALLKTCAEDICNICKVVDNALCCRPKPPVPQEPDPNNC